MAYESPTYRVEERIGEIELRRYEPYLVAETLVRGSLERAGTGGFRLLAGYIFGGNQTTAGDSTKIAMTTPVTQDRVGDEYRVRFMMPNRYTGDSLPTPNDPRVTIAELVTFVNNRLSGDATTNRRVRPSELGRLSQSRV